MIYSTQFLSPQEIKRHHLQGLTYSERKEKSYQKTWKGQVLKNHLVYEEIRSLEPVFERRNIAVTLLKGFALLGELYKDWGARFASDVDLLVTPENLTVAVKILENSGFKVLKEEQWLGNDFKVVMSKPTQLLDITVELHTRLFWHQKIANYKTRSHNSYRWFRRLDHEDQLVHLCGHLAFQHTFIKLFWFFDIQRYIQKNLQDIDWALFWVRSNEYRVLESSQLCLWMLDFSIEWDTKVSFKQKMLRRLCKQRFLLNPRFYPGRYFLIKSLLKDRWQDSVIYYCQWIRFKSAQKFRSLLDALNNNYKE